MKLNDKLKIAAVGLALVIGLTNFASIIKTGMSLGYTRFTQGNSAMEAQASQINQSIDTIPKYIVFSGSKLVTSDSDAFGY